MRREIVVRSHVVELVVLFALLMTSCSSDYGASLGVGGGANDRFTQRSIAPVPVNLHLVGIATLRQSPVHAFGFHENALRARVGSSAAVTVEADRLALDPDAQDFSLGLRATHIGRDLTAALALRLDATDTEGQELILTRGAIEERYLAGPLGLEQSFHLAERPSGSGPLRIEVTFDGLEPELAPDATDLVTLHDANGAARAVYRDLAAADAAGRELPAHMEVDSAVVALVIDDADAVYPVTVDPLIAVLQQKLVASDGAANAGLGELVSISGDTAIAGATWAVPHGAAYVFARNGATWSQQTKLTPNLLDDEFGRAVAVSGDTAVVTALPEVAYVFVRSGATWTQQATLYANENKSNGFGYSVAIAGDTLVVGTPGYWATCDAGGAAFVFVRSGTTWSKQAKLLPDDCGLVFGGAVSVSGDTIAVGARSVPYDLSGPGLTYVFTRTGTTWSQQAKLVVGDGPSDVVNVSVSQDTLVVGMRQEANATGAAYVFSRTGAVWSPQAKLTASDGAAQDHFGHSVSVSGDLAAVGAFSNANGRGAAYVFTRSGTTWTQLPKVLASDGAAGDLFGIGVGVDGETVVVGAPYSANKGAAYVFVPRKSQGDPCGAASECASGFCVDGVCCDAACGGSITTDCQACSVAAGAAAEGTCGPIGDGTGCDDGNACTQTDACQSGVCTGSNPVVCAALDQCHDAGTCDPANGACSDPAKLDGTACDDDNACTQTDTCQSGTCTGGNPVTCAASDECYDVGTCDPITGACSEFAKPDGTPCSAGTCSAGACVGSASSSSSGGGAGGAASSSSSGGAGGAASSSSSGAGGSISTGSGGQPSSTSSSSSSSSGDSVAFGGCGCRATDDDPEHAPLLLGLLTASLAARRRRRANLT